ncbi:hypothetical protein ACF073_11625 [Streptomyces sp. NPDC015171]|uniref:hypothetical protein n=1 Tax=Streptomyces sp. NPDC015171 TaxID=3364945 RepID=UPI0036FBD1C4
MNPLQVLASAAADWERLEPYLTDLPGEAGRRLASALEAMRGPDGAAEDPAHAEAAARLVLDSLPPHETRRLIAGDDGRYSDTERNITVQGFRAADLAVLLIDRSPMVGPVLGPVRRRLLAEPALDDTYVRDQGGDPLDPALIRLPGPQGRTLLPDFQFSRGALPWRVVLEVNTILDADRDPWGVADWWLSDNAWLGSAPASLLGAARDEELAGAARSLLDGE